MQNTTVQLTGSMIDNTAKVGGGKACPHVQGACSGIAFGKTQRCWLTYHIILDGGYALLLALKALRLLKIHLAFMFSNADAFVYQA